MNILPTEIHDLLILEPKVFGDSLGFFLESFNARIFEKATGIDVASAIIEFVEAACEASGIDPAVIRKEIPFLGVLVKKEQDTQLVYSHLAGRQ